MFVIKGTMTPLWEFVMKHPTIMNWVPGVSYGSPLTIDTKSVPTFHVWRDCDVITIVMLKIAKIVKNRQNLGFLPFFVTKMCTYVVMIGVRVHLGMVFIKINSIKYKHCKYLLTSFLCFSHWKVQIGSQWPFPHLRLLMISSKRLVKSFVILAQLGGKLRGVIVTPPPPW